MTGRCARSAPDPTPRPMGTKSRAPATLLTATARQTREVACAFSPFSGAIRILAVSLVMNSRDAEYGLPCSRAEHDISNNDALRAALHSYRRVVLHSDRVNCRMDAVLPVITADPEVAPRACRCEQGTAGIACVLNVDAVQDAGRDRRAGNSHDTVRVERAGSMGGRRRQQAGRRNRDAGGARCRLQRCDIAVSSTRT